LVSPTNFPNFHEFSKFKTGKLKHPHVIRCQQKC
jgi:hypothetical protein